MLYFGHKQLSSNFSAIFVLSLSVRFGARILPGVLGSLKLYSDNPLDFHARIPSLLIRIVKKLKSGWSNK